MAGDIASASDLTTAPVSPMEQQVLGQVPVDASADDAALEAHIAEIAGGTIGANLSDPRYAVKAATSDTKAEGTAGSADGNAGSGTGGDASDGDGAAAKTEAGEENGQGTGDQGIEPPQPKVEAAPVVRDYTLTVQGADTTDAEGKTIPGQEYKIEKIEDLPEDFNPRNNRQILQIINDLNKLEATKATDDARASVEAEKAAATAAQEEMLVSWDAEITALQKAGTLEAPKLKPTDANYLTDPAMKKVSDVFAFMEKTNNERTKVGNPNLIRSFADAYDKMELADRKAKEAQAAKDEVETAKLKASVVGGGKAGGGTSSAPVYRAGQAQDIREVL